MNWLREAGRILQTVGIWLLVATVVSAVIDQHLNLQLQNILLSDDGGGARLWLLAGASLLNGLIFPTLLIALAIYGITRHRGSDEPLTSYAARIFEQLYIETLRAWGSALRWGLLFILPAFVRLFQLTFVPFIVALHGPYARGEADALRTSRLLVQRRWFKVLAAVVLFTVLIPLMLTSALDPWRSYDTTPAGAVACSVIDVAVTILSVQVFFRIFESAQRSPA